MADRTSEQYAAGVELRERLFGASTPTNPLAAEMMDITNEHLFGSVWTRPGLELRDRSMITVAALIVLGREAQLKVHLTGALNLGLSPETLSEMMLHLAHYGGWPVAMTALRILKEVVDARDE